MAGTIVFDEIPRPPVAGAEENATDNSVIKAMKANTRHLVKPKVPPCNSW
eukprot:CAMPEP_0117682288 /NCGR_PEP_ID=MMETSP0804-20121206/19561_1 /TAXON_ID=1074897 /ORGANISM="Tetraselmis astigmatica, Strain CCMP880" /LENGTH=49 /DNA_ID= /DNA_START= /DNA_END= /DNA_ORIENTATION=